jgi:integrase
MNFDELIEHLIAKGCSDQTIIDYTNTYNRFFERFDELNETNIISFLAGVSPSTVRKYRTQLKKLAWYYKIDIDFDRRIPEPKMRYEAPLTLTEQDELRMIDFIERRDHKAARMVRFLLETGLRISELEALTPAAYTTRSNANGRVFHLLRISTDMNTHSANGRWVPLTVTAKHIIEEFGLPFNIDRRRFNDLIVNCRTRLKMPGYKIHSMRKTFATRCIHRGLNDSTVEAILGHGKAKTLQQYAGRDALTLCELFFREAA